MYLIYSFLKNKLQSLEVTCSYIKAIEPSPFLTRISSFDVIAAAEPHNARLENSLFFKKTTFISEKDFVY